MSNNAHKTGTDLNLACCSDITATFGQLPVTESVVLPPQGNNLMKISEKYRIKALDCEQQGRNAKDYDLKCAWGDVAIEWHCLAAQRAHEVSQGAGKHTEITLKTAPVAGPFRFMEC
jgi:hypothetical protein